MCIIIFFIFIYIKFYFYFSRFLRLACLLINDAAVVYFSLQAI